MGVALLAGGTGGAKLGAGIQEEIGSGLSVIANTGDDVELLGVHVSPDPDLITYWLSGEIDAERLDVVAGVGDHRQVGAELLLHPGGELGAAGAAGE